MNTSTLRALGSDSALDYLCDALDLSIIREWKKGETNRRGGVYEISGFNADVVADAENPSSLVEEIRWNSWNLICQKAPGLELPVSLEKVCGFLNEKKLDDGFC